MSEWVSATKCNLTNKGPLYLCDDESSFFSSCQFVLKLENWSTSFLFWSTDMRLSSKKVLLFWASWPRGRRRGRRRHDGPFTSVLFRPLLSLSLCYFSCPQYLTKLTDVCPVQSKLVIRMQLVSSKSIHLSSVILLGSGFAWKLEFGKRHQYFYEERYSSIECSYIQLWLYVYIYIYIYSFISVSICCT